MPPLLEVKKLHTEFRTGAEIVRAVDGISYTVDPGETVAIVGESGSGKSVSALSVLRLIPDPPGRITGGEILFGGRDLLQLSDAEMREVRGGEIGMVFQEPMTSLNPVWTISLAATQIGEPHRIFLIDIAAEDEPSNLHVFINPEIVKKEGEQCGPEGCLSFPGITEDIKRAAKVTVRALDRDGKPFELARRRPARRGHPARERSPRRRADDRPHGHAQEAHRPAQDAEA